ncbi:Lrp/AsnC family transcriptional regulator [Pectobacterium odoriferum]|uniref:Lrp/AsnC family transcriptional regulator n=1 Tax=Pectobacterium TaxID=122277 RepID=UPI00052A1B1B|nr:MULTISPECIES: Lrp/AsnC family transcriptional regulator [Pectobacterium]QQG27646.1 Lrp/AsnC family transcriptional regulator [Pectobacterium carotovorum]AIU87450.1 AsnC family transcriptional regulator [Pectobacterium odoriferum]POE16028.1 AsnC family transcriptional regulator [Pectobacterium odoriferum]POE31650.1 AsnC family transcriptional regulator [Pectobacterium odoriferum]TAJ05126.1 Lrp/AsnC family transcriptional regulator [Pectobacterium versatile]
MKLDAIDRRILAALVNNGRMTTAEVAERIGLSPTPCGRRIRQMEMAGVIEGYSVKLNPGALGLGICVLISVKLSRPNPEAHREFVSAVSGMKEVTECMLVTGESDYMLRVWVKDMDTLADFVPTVLQGIPCVAETSTTLVMKHIGGTPLIP